MSKLIEWSEAQARENYELIATTVLAPNSKQGRHAGLVGNFKEAGVFSHYDLDAATGCYKWVRHDKWMFCLMRFLPKPIGPLKAIGVS